MSDPTNTLESLSDALSGLVARAAPGVVALQFRRARSSGLVWKPGLVVTADEPLAEDGDTTAVLPGGERVAATVAGRDPTTDVALLRAADASCLASARSWRKQAEHLRDNAEAAYLTAGQRATLLREAEAAERQADWWLDAITAH